MSRSSRSKERTGKSIGSLGFGVGCFGCVTLVCRVLLWAGCLVDVVDVVDVVDGSGRRPLSKPVAMTVM